MLKTITLSVDFEDLSLSAQAESVDEAIASAPIPTGSLVSAQIIASAATWTNSGSDAQGEYAYDHRANGALILLTYRDFE